MLRNTLRLYGTSRFFKDIKRMERFYETNTVGLFRRALAVLRLEMECHDEGYRLGLYREVDDEFIEIE